MTCFSLSLLADHILLRELAVLVTQDRATTAALLAHIAEVDERRLYLPAACSSMYDYCVRRLRMSEDTAFKRIRVARTARQFPVIFAALADGRLNQTSVLLLTPHLKLETAHDLIEAAANRSKAEIELLLAERFPLPDLPTLVQAMPPAGPADELAVQPVTDPTLQLAPEPVVPSDESTTLAFMEPLAARPAAYAKLAPLAPGRFALQLTVNQATHDLLRYAQALLGHALPSGDVAEVIERALRELVRKLEQQKFAASARSRPDPDSGRGSRGAAKGRYVTAEIRRIVWPRDGGQRTFVSDGGTRCEARTRLEFDHVDLIARGGTTTVAGLRLRCRAHNQYTAECTLGAGFMREKRQEARCKAAQARAMTAARENTQARAQTAAQVKEQLHARSEAAPEIARPQDVTPWLRQLGCSPQEARRGAAHCAHIPDAPLEQRVRVALQGLAPHCVRRDARVVSNVP
jgi:hypothetical protein